MKLKYNYCGESMISFINKIVRCEWMSKVFFIRLYLILFWVIIVMRVVADKVDNALVGIVVAQVVALIGLKTTEKIYAENRDVKKPIKK